MRHLGHLKLHLSGHCVERGQERFGANAKDLEEMVWHPEDRLNIVDRKKNDDGSVCLSPKTVLVSRAPNGAIAYFVVDIQARVATVLTETMAMNNLRNEKWIRI